MVKFSRRKINDFYQLFQKILERYQDRIERRRIITLKPEKSSIGNVLISYITKPFLPNITPEQIRSHTQMWECQQMAQTFLDMGYCVDVINFYNDIFIPEKRYDFFIETRWNLQRSAPYLNPDCIKIFHADTAHILFHNAAEAKRLLDLQQRRGVTLAPRRFEQPNHALEHADYAMVLGNEFTVGTYKYANKPIYPISVSTPVTYPWNESKDFDKCRKNFLFFSSGGMVHKGLDLALEAFVEMPDFHLTICGPVDKEDDFVKAYYRELYETENIHTVGWVDVSSDKFQEIADNCIGLVYPSCSEGQSGAVISCLHQGLIPILSYKSGVTVDNFGLILPNCSIPAIKQAVNRISQVSTADLKWMSRQAWEYARANHTQERFAQVYKETIEKIQQNHNSRQSLNPQKLPVGVNRF
ncbi:glycosyltransferase [Calothrix sp. NIES-3974]|uniref:glycosyltransferase n=1 Tax=Calothrix sp. NIES-3974 TaxID=2005462 RepID=UPI000B600E34|nr:glycosyltransferase [Calothrix sp. NIES-3974]BAZ03705.1 group 1 glycosyl transferase [Calothrix sp. NIES-3974]